MMSPKYPHCVDFTDTNLPQQ